MNGLDWIVEFGSVGANLVIVYMFLKYQEKYYGNHMSNVTKALERLAEKVSNCPHNKG